MEINVEKNTNITKYLDFEAILQIIFVTPYNKDFPKIPIQILYCLR